jgi:hypothetical protein
MTSELVGGVGPREVEKPWSVVLAIDKPQALEAAEWFEVREIVWPYRETPVYEERCQRNLGRGEDVSFTQGKFSD